MHRSICCELLNEELEEKTKAVFRRRFGSLFEETVQNIVTNVESIKVCHLCYIPSADFRSVVALPAPHPFHADPCVQFSIPWNTASAQNDPFSCRSTSTAP